ncbi:hypothetical protein ASPFODRAFT_40754 [Aspergillus luchuensis CBS 106.47]|uniref:Uncharacterized protein n=1 Tax=Aspergillus luchuensis (strain CBS 106.47) TaxID=1137211 RepID=A0A1M3TUA3_ASPLC|nr:hypothetical protein ASPFODRAFT_40754 [Aspergillus luchuensis CBS 106.47]
MQSLQQTGLLPRFPESSTSLEWPKAQKLVHVLTAVCLVFHFHNLDTSVSLLATTPFYLLTARLRIFGARQPRLSFRMDWLGIPRMANGERGQSRNDRGAGETCKLHNVGT